jgi:hypothetical protein
MIFTGKVISDGLGKAGTVANSPKPEIMALV